MGNDICIQQSNVVCNSSCTSEYFNKTFCDESTYVTCNAQYQMLDNICTLGFISALLILFFFIGIVGNACVCLVILRQSSMRTPTHYYLFSLAISDLFILFGIPYTIYVRFWHAFPDMFGPFVCRLSAAIAEIGVYASVLTVVAFSVERYMAICHPFRTVSCVDPLKRVVIIIFGIWGLSIACSIPLTIQYGIRRFIEYPPGSGSRSELTTVCANEPGDTVTEYMKVTTVLFFFIPMAVLIAMYSRIAICLWKRKQNIETQQMQGGQLHSSKVPRQERIAVTVLAAVVVGFFICWLPFHVQRVIEWDSADPLNFIIVTIITETFKYLSAAINPIMYSAMSQTYRKAFKASIMGPSVKFRCGSQRVHISSLTNTTSVRSEGKNRYIKNNHPSRPDAYQSALA